MYLQNLHETYKDKGLVVLGLDCSDERSIALDYLREKGATYPNILDTSDAALATAHRHYRTNSVPVTYVIDREGRVAAAWSGYRKGDQRGAKILQKLGIAGKL